MASRALISRSKASIFASALLRSVQDPAMAASELNPRKAIMCVGLRENHDGRPRGPLWKGKKQIGKEALFVISGLKRAQKDPVELDNFFKKHVDRLLKLEMVVVLHELERQKETQLAIRMFEVIRKQAWYKPDVYMYKDLICALAYVKKMDDVAKIWELVKKDKLYPDSETYGKIIRGYLRIGSPGDAMNIYEDMKKSPDPPEEAVFRILLKGLIPHPLLRNRVKQDFEDVFPEKHMDDPPEEIFGVF